MSIERLLTVLLTTAASILAGALALRFYGVL